jgi:ParB-like chromosome segregation protein Spo0J
MEVTRAAEQPAAGVEMLPINQIRPDPFQARRILPPAVRAGFVVRQLDPPGALAAWRALAEDDPIEAELLQEQIIGLANSIRAQEMVNPVTVCDDGAGGYLLETGERRWWAHWWLVSVEGEPAFGRIRGEIVAASRPERQAAENLQDSPLTAVQEAGQIARLLLHLTERDSDHVVAILAGEDDESAQALVGYDVHREALELDRGAVYGKWPAISEIMGHGERHLLRQLAVLKLADEALDLADRARLTEGQLRPLVSVAAETQADRQLDIVSLAARYDLPGAEVARLVRSADLEAAEARIRRLKGLDPGPPAAIRRPSSIMVERLRGVRRLAARQQKGGLQIYDLLQEIVASGEADTIYEELSELTEMLVQLREGLAESLGR